MIHAIALDDEPLALNVIKTMASDFDFIHLGATFTRPSEALKYLAEFPVDLIFLDIKMPTTMGTDFAQKLKPNVMVLFTTAYDDYAVESYNLNAVDYLMKPISKLRFEQSMQKVQRMYDYAKQDKQQEKYIFVRADFSSVKIPVQDILYIEGLADYLKIFIKGRKPLVTRMTVKNMVKMLPEKEFMRIHRSYIIPLERIVAVKNKCVTLPEKDIPIGNTFQKKVSEISQK